MQLAGLHRSTVVLFCACALTSCGGSWLEDVQQDVDELDQISQDFADAAEDLDDALRLFECKVRTTSEYVREACERIYGSSAGQSQRKSFSPSAGATLPPDRKAKSARTTLPPEPKVTVDTERLKENCSRYLELTDDLDAELNLLIGDSASREKTISSWPASALIAYDTWSRFLGSSVQLIVDDLIASGLLASSQVQPIRNIAFDAYSATPVATKDYVTKFNNVFELPCKMARTL